MKGSRVTSCATICLLLSMCACVLLVRHIDKTRPQQQNEDALYINSPNLVRRASLGFNGLMACIYWTRVVQYFGHRHYEHASTFNELAPLLEITTTLDPQLLPPYQFGASFLAPNPPNGAGQPDRAIQLMEYGIQHNPDIGAFITISDSFTTPNSRITKKPAKYSCAGQGLLTRIRS